MTGFFSGSLWLITAFNCGSICSMASQHGHFTSINSRFGFAIRLILYGQFALGDRAAGSEAENHCI